MPTLNEKLEEAIGRRDAANGEVKALQYQISCVGKTVLDTPMEENGSGADTIRGYLKALLTRLWEEGEGFGGKGLSEIAAGNTTFTGHWCVPVTLGVRLARTVMTCATSTARPATR